MVTATTTSLVACRTDGVRPKPATSDVDTIGSKFVVSRCTFRPDPVSATARPAQEGSDAAARFLQQRVPRWGWTDFFFGDTCTGGRRAGKHVIKKRAATKREKRRGLVTCGFVARAIFSMEHGVAFSKRPCPSPVPMSSRLVLVRLALASGLLAINSSVLAQTAATPASAARAQRQPRNPINDAYYKLGPDSQPMAGVPKGKFSEARIIPSQVFPGTQHTYHVYVPAQYDASRPAALMIFNDGQAMMAEPGDVQAHHVLDNLIHRREIPVMLGVFINPGRRPDQPEPTPRDWGDNTTNRREEYNPPNDQYARVIVDELLPALQKDYTLSSDPELRGIAGASSGAIAAFRVAWFRPDQFRKVVSVTGSFVDIRGGTFSPSSSPRVRRNRSGFSCRTAATTIAAPPTRTATGFLKTCD